MNQYSLEPTFKYNSHFCIASLMNVNVITDMNTGYINITEILKYVINCRKKIHTEFCKKMGINMKCKKGHYECTTDGKSPNYGSLDIGDYYTFMFKGMGIFDRNVSSLSLISNEMRKHGKYATYESNEYQSNEYPGTYIHKKLFKSLHPCYTSHNLVGPHNNYGNRNQADPYYENWVMTNQIIKWILSAKEQKPEQEYKTIGNDINITVHIPSKKINITRLVKTWNEFAAKHDCGEFYLEYWLPEVDILLKMPDSSFKVTGYFAGLYVNELIIKFLLDRLKKDHNSAAKQFVIYVESLKNYL